MVLTCSDESVIEGQPSTAADLVNRAGEFLVKPAISGTFPSYRCWEGEGAFQVSSYLLPNSITRGIIEHFSD
jgi:hypothetical protein